MNLTEIRLDAERQRIPMMRHPEYWKAAGENVAGHTTTVVRVERQVKEPVARPERHCVDCNDVISPKPGKQALRCVACRIKESEMKAMRSENRCVNCNAVIPHTGKRGRQPSRCTACR